MFFPEGQIRVQLYGEPVDMRKSFDGLSALAMHGMGQNPLNGQLFVFINRRATQVKVLYFDRSGFCVWAKRLEAGRFLSDWRVVRSREMDWTALKLLLEGIEPGSQRPYVEVRRTMTDIFKRNYRCYGYRRMHASLSRPSMSLSEKVVRRLMKQERLVPILRKRRRYGSYMGEISPAPDNVLNRDFSASAPNEKWLTDITEFQIPAGKVYLSPMIDCFDGMIVSWSIGTRPDAELVNTMLDAAIETVATSSDRPVVHSDRGGHYRWPGWLSRIAEAKLVRSMSRKACSPDNAACEGFFGRLKNELFYARNWLTTTIDEFISALDSYIRWYNEARIKISLGSRSPIEYRRTMGIAA
jgi:transposase InsO family protein